MMSNEGGNASCLHVLYAERCVTIGKPSASCGITEGKRDRPELWVAVPRPNYLDAFAKIPDIMGGRNDLLWGSP
jgi:hypothetical protein